jgi:aminopeptidase YwaD
MRWDDLAARALRFVDVLCRVKPNRRTGSAGNRQAAEFAARTIGSLEYQIDSTPFDCLDWLHGEALLAAGDRAFPVLPSPYTLGCDVTATLVAAQTLEELAATDSAGKVLLLHGPLCAEQLMPKGFVFYNPAHHQEIIALLEALKPAAIVTATARSPEQVGALYPFPLIVDGDFDIPNVHCTDAVGADLAGQAGQVFRLKIEAERRPSSASNVIARLNPTAPEKVVVTAHIDAYEDAPGALDNASGTAVLLLLAGLLADYPGPLGVEIAAFNGEDHYSAGGQMDYLRRYGEELRRIRLVVNLDDVGYLQGASAYSFYECTPELQAKAESVFRGYAGLVQGEPWVMGDHMVFVQQGIAAIAFASEEMPELMRTVTHTARDTPGLVDGSKLAEIAQALNHLIRTL